MTEERRSAAAQAGVGTGQRRRCARGGHARRDVTTYQAANAADLAKILAVGGAISVPGGLTFRLPCNAQFSSSTEISLIGNIEDGADGPVCAPASIATIDPKLSRAPNQHRLC
ncbi:MAG: hypothetical protein U1E25_00305 [Methylocystis sp.]